MQIFLFVVLYVSRFYVALMHDVSRKNVGLVKIVRSDYGCRNRKDKNSDGIL